MRDATGEKRRQSTENMKILLIEDDDDLREIIVRSLTGERHIVETAADCATARMKTGVYEYDCVLLDIMLPDGDGLDILRFMADKGRKSNVIILSAKDSIEDKVHGLNLGADDYIAKPFHLAELHARIKSVARRGLKQEENVIGLGNVRVYPDTFRAFAGDTPIELGRKEYDILVYFINRPNRLIDKQMIAEAVWGDVADAADNFDFVYAQMKNLRKRLKNAGADIEIKTVYGFGYKMVNNETD